MDLFEILNIGNQSIKIFERELALLVALQGASIWKVDPETVSRGALKSVMASVSQARSFKSRVP